MTGVARELISEANPDQVAVLAAELPMYLRARRIAVDWLPAALAQVHPPLREAIERAVRAAKARDVVATNGRALHKAMTAARQTGKFRQPPLTSPLPYDPDAEPVGAGRGPTTRDGGPASG